MTALMDNALCFKCERKLAKPLKQTNSGSLLLTRAATGKFVSLAIAALIAGFFCMSKASPSNEYEGSTAESKANLVSINVGCIESIMLSSGWLEDEGYEKDQSTPKDRHFYIPRKSWSECQSSITVEVPIEPQPAVASQLEAAFDKPDHELRLEEVKLLKDLIEPGVHDQYLHFAERLKNGALSCATKHINGKRLLVIATSGQTRGPCVWLPDGSSRIPLLQYKACTLYVPLPQGRLQQIYFSSDIMGEPEAACLRSTQKAIESIRWNDIERKKR